MVIAIECNRDAIDSELLYECSHVLVVRIIISTVAYKYVLHARSLDKSVNLLTRKIASSKEWASEAMDV